jgi:hypothetical protein
MKNSKRFLPPIVIGILMMAAFSLVQGVPAEGELPATYSFLIGIGSVCNSSEPGGCLAVSRADNGESIEISGAGIFSLPEKSITGAGTFTRKTSNGVVVESGIWIASELVKFQSYGVVPGPIDGQPGFHSPRMRAFGLDSLAGSSRAGGLALIRVRLWPDRGGPKEAFLQVNCALGKVPEKQQGDGVRVAIEDGGLKFGEKVSGKTILMLRKPGKNPVAQLK